MTVAIAFDTHRFVKNLTANGFTEQQAEALAEEQVQLLEGNLTTRSDIAAIRTDIAAIRSDIAAIRTDLRKVEAGLQVDIQTVRADLLRWMVAALTAQTAVIAGLFAGLVRFF